MHVKGTDIPQPADSFSVLAEKYGVNKTIIENLQKYGYETPTPIQMQAVPAMLDVS